jgi:surfeit locus 1 family protein
VLRANPLTLRRLDRLAIEEALGVPVHALYVIAMGDSAVTAGSVPLMRLEEPRLENGPHLGYALQWFAFATVALGGTVVLTLVKRRPAMGPDDAMDDVRRTQS